MGGMPQVVAVAGAGTMGAGIAQLACLAGATTLVYDPDGAALQRGLGRIERDVRRLGERGRLDRASAEAALARLRPVGALAALAPAELVFEAAPEDADL